MESEPADKLLALQRSAGNQAVSALLARSPDGAKPKETDKERPRPREPERRCPASARSRSCPSASAGAPRAGRRAGRGSARAIRKSGGEIAFASKAGEHSSKLFKASIDGQPMVVEVIMPGGKSALRIELKGAIVSNYVTSGEGDDATESWTLNFESMEHSTEGEGEGGG